MLKEKLNKITSCVLGDNVGDDNDKDDDDDNDGGVKETKKKKQPV